MLVPFVGRWVSAVQWGVGVAVDAEAGEQLGAELGQLGRAAVARADARDGHDLADRRAAGARLGAEQDHPVGELEGLVDVVGDEQHRRRRRGVDVEEEVLHLQPGQGVERPERLVEQQHPRVAGQGAGERRPLGHAARDLARPMAGEGRQPDELEQLARRARDRRRRRPGRQPERDVAGQRPPRQEPRLLERDGAARVDAGSTGRRRSGPRRGRRVEPGGDAQERRLAAAARAEDGDDLAGPDRQRDVAQDDVRRRSSARRRPGTSRPRPCEADAVVVSGRSMPARRRLVGGGRCVGWYGRSSVGLVGSAFDGRSMAVPSGCGVGGSPRSRRDTEKPQSFVGLRPRDRRWSRRHVSMRATYRPVSPPWGRQGIHISVERRVGVIEAGP